MDSEKIKNEFLHYLNGMSAENMTIATQAFEKTMMKYNVTAKETAIATINDSTNLLLDVYLKLELSKGRPDNSVNNYGYRLKLFFASINKAPCEITAVDVIQYLIKYQNQRNLTPQSINVIRSTLCSFFSWAQKTGYVKSNPVELVPKFKETKRQRDFLTEEELEELRYKCETLFEKALIELMVSTACRIAEISNIRLRDIDWTDNTISVIGKNSKQRKVLMTPKCRINLKAFIDADRNTESDNYLFRAARAPRRRLNEESLRIKFESVVARTYFKDSKNVTPHTMRHTWATLALKKGMTIEKVSKYLGHEQLSTTMIYIGLDCNEINRDVLKYAV